MRIFSTFPFSGSLCLGVTALLAAPPDPSVFETSTWAEAPLLQNPVSLSFDTEGRLYVVETTRRGAVDVDIRSHKPWVVEDLANQSIDDFRSFVRRRFAPEASASNQKWPADLNEDGRHDWRDLTELSDSLRVLEDLDGDGRADQSTVFATGFNEEITGVAEGVLWHENDVFYTIFPDLWKLKDTNKDRVADERESLFRGFGVHAAFDGHDIHGLTVGPDGKLYFSVGDNGTSVRTKEGELLHYPNQGLILRCDYDGANLEVFAHGLRNPQEIAFDDFGNLFTVDNDGDMRGERERFVYLVEGGDSGWRLNWQFRTEGWSKYTKQPLYNPWIDERMWVPHEPGQPAFITPPLSNYSIGPGGFKYHPGIGLNDAYRGYFFLVQFPAKVVSAFRAVPKGASFEMADEHPFHEGLMISAVHFGNDGAFYMADWEGKWMPNEKGSIKKVDDPREAGSPRRRELERLLRTDLDGEDHLALLGYPDQRVRQRAQAHLVRRGAGEALMNVAESTQSPQLARIHALWGLQQLKGNGVERFVERLPFHDRDPEIQAQCAKVAGALTLSKTGALLVKQLNHPSARVRFFAAIALGKAPHDRGFEALVRMLEENNEQDAYLRHAGAMGLRGYEATATLSKHPSKAVRLAAVVALRKAANPHIAAFLNDDDPEVIAEAARAIHDDFSIPQALPALSKCPPQGNEGLVRRILNANLRVGTAEAAERLTSYALNEEHPSALRLEAALCLVHWDADPYLDRVTGRVRELDERNDSLGRKCLQRVWPDLIATADSEMLRGLTRLADDHELPLDLSLIEKLTTTDSHASAVRAEAIALLTKRQFARLPDVLPQWLQSKDAEVRIAARKSLAQTNTEAFFEFVASTLGETIAERQSTYQLLGEIKDPRATAILETAFQDLLKDAIKPELRLDVFLAAKAQESLAPQVGKFEAALPQDDPLAVHRMTLQGGDLGRGKQIVHTHASTQCLRCHNIDAKTQQLGPNLAGVGSRLTPDALLESLILPNATIAEGFDMVSLEIKNRTTPVAGTVLEETEDAWMISQLGGDAIKVSKDSVENIQRLSLSSMPPMAGVLSLPEIRDVLAYLRSLTIP